MNGLSGLKPELPADCDDDLDTWHLKAGQQTSQGGVRIGLHTRRHKGSGGFTHCTCVASLCSSRLSVALPETYRAAWSTPRAMGIRVSAVMPCLPRPCETELAWEYADPGVVSGGVAVARRQRDSHRRMALLTLRVRANPSISAGIDAKDPSPPSFSKGS